MLALAHGTKLMVIIQIKGFGNNTSVYLFHLSKSIYSLSSTEAYEWKIQTWWLIVANIQFSLFISFVFVAYLSLCVCVSDCDLLSSRYCTVHPPTPKYKTKEMVQRDVLSSCQATFWFKEIQRHKFACSSVADMHSRLPLREWKQKACVN